MPYSDDIHQEIESYLGFLIDHELDDAYETEPLNRTLSENKQRFQRAAASSAQIHVTPAASSDAINALRPQSLAHFDLGAALHEARQRAAAARSFDELYAELDGFQHMPLRFEGAKHLVRFRGSATPGLMVIGEPPDPDEDESGAAFAGKPGEMMDRALKAAGLDAQSLLAPCVPWRPAGGRPLTGEDVSLAAPFLHALIRLAQPKALLLLGAPAVACALNLDQSLSKLRGRIVSYHENKLQLPVVASYPPRFLISQPQAKALFWHDLLELKVQAGLTSL
jgi:DNA polymerase